MRWADKVLLLATGSFMFSALAFVTGIWSTFPWSFLPVVCGGYIMGRSLRIIIILYKETE